MGQGATTWLILFVALIAANLPYFSSRLLLVGPLRSPKAFGWRALELTLLAVATLWLGFGLEASQGQRQAQDWEFYVCALCVYLVLGFPGFVWRYLWRRRHG